jgi:hypothetical protein
MASVKTTTTTVTLTITWEKKKLSEILSIAKLREQDVSQVMEFHLRQTVTWSPLGVAVKQIETQQETERG